MDKLKSSISKNKFENDGLKASQLLNDTLNGIAVALNGSENFHKEREVVFGPLVAIIG